MTNLEQLDCLKQGVEEWNKWREENPEIQVELWGANLNGMDLQNIDLSDANLIEVDLSGANLSDADLRGAVLTESDLSEATLIRAMISDAWLFKANLHKANFSNAWLIKSIVSLADLTEAVLVEANLSESKFDATELSRADLTEAYLNLARFDEANLSEAKLVKADFYEASLNEANLTNADLSDANLERANLVETDLTGANLSGCRIYGISAWNLNLTGTKQDNLIITREGEPKITVDNLEVAQFVYLLLNNKKLRDLIDTIGKKAVLILGRFSSRRKPVLEAIAQELRKGGKYIPIIFDFEKPDSRDLTETIVTLAHLSRFIIADLSDPHSIPFELRSIVPTLPSVPVQPIFCPVKAHPNVFPMFENLRAYPWVLGTEQYKTKKDLIMKLPHLIEQLEIKAKEVRPHDLRELC